MKCPILQSGFLSSHQEGLVNTEPLSEDQFIRAVELGKPVDTKGNSYFYNKDIDALYKRYSNEHRLLNEFDFREAIYFLAKTAFGGSNIEAWFSLQLDSPYLTTTHRRFLNDTMAFIFTGQRSVSCENWMGLIYPKLSTTKDKAVEVLIGDYFGGDTPKLPIGFIDLIARWTQQPGGVLDLLCFLTIVFSKHSSTTV